MLFRQSNSLYYLLLLSVTAIGTQEKQINDFDNARFIIPLLDPLGENGEGVYEKYFS